MNCELTITKRENSRETEFEEFSRRSPSYKCLPPFPWLGGKRRLIPHLVGRMPHKFTAYYEPFVGGGALFFSEVPPNSHLSDASKNVVAALHAIKTNVKMVISILRRHYSSFNKEHYEKISQSLSIEEDPIVLGANFVFLMKNCYRSIYKISKTGNFSGTFYGRPPVKFSLYERDLLKCADALQSATIRMADFKDVPIEKGAFYYFDPPYDGVYSKYGGNNGTSNLQNDLADLCREIDKQGGYFMISNSDTENVRRLYANFVIENIPIKWVAKRDLNTKGKAFPIILETVIRNYTL